MKPERIAAVYDVGRPHLDIDQLAERWHCSPQTIRQNWKKWGLHAMRFGRRLLFSFEDIEAAEKRRGGM